jgi:hypothetical protein
VKRRPSPSMSFCAAAWNCAGKTRPVVILRPSLVCIDARYAVAHLPLASLGRARARRRRRTALARAALCMLYVTNRLGPYYPPLAAEAGLSATKVLFAFNSLSYM